MPRKAADDRPQTPFAERLIAVRELYALQTGRPGLDKKDFAALIGKEAQTYRRYEKGETEPNIETLIKIRKLTGVSLNYLIAGEPDVVQEQPRTKPNTKPHLVTHRR
jgi:transcriptional regulator with XRE-family HTH domain